MENICDNCKYYSYDRSCDDANCKKLDVMTEEEYEKYYIQTTPDCPYHEQYDIKDI